MEAWETISDANKTILQMSRLKGSTSDGDEKGVVLAIMMMMLIMMVMTMMLMIIMIVMMIPPLVQTSNFLFPLFLLVNGIFLK